ncbi:MAG: preprotein translocase subunit SecG, partial [Flavobacteriales bacterium]|nr:preprotein translocase subunit SecG [Flavobacteriales bacterium]
MGYVLLVLILIIAILLGAVILVQNPKGTGLASGFEAAGKIGGVQRTTDFLEKSTWYL